jgi:3-(3-hydroxy-phenyl)propionate hydroxylase
VIGGQFALLSWRCDPLSQAPAALSNQLQALGCFRLVGVRARSGSSEPGMSAAGPAVAVIQDMENDLQLWFQKKNVDWVLLRPDRFVAAAGLAKDAPARLREFCDAVLPATADASMAV